MKSNTVKAGLSIAVMFLVFVFLLGGCSGGQPVTPTEKISVAAGSDVQLPAMVWRIRDPQGLREEYAAANGGRELGALESLQGFAAKGSSGTVYIYTLPPRYVDDEVTLTLGHEVMHVVLGDYHPAFKGH